MTSNDTEQRVATKPFHEAIVGAIPRASGWLALRCLEELIMEVTIPDDPENFDAIMAAWVKKREEMLLIGEDIDLRVTANLLERKQVAEAKASAKQKSNGGEEESTPLGESQQEGQELRNPSTRKAMKVLEKIESQRHQKAKTNDSSVLGPANPPLANTGPDF